MPIHSNLYIYSWAQKDKRGAKEDDALSLMQENYFTLVLYVKGKKS